MLCIFNFYFLTIPSSSIYSGQEFSFCDFLDDSSGDGENLNFEIDLIDQLMIMIDNHNSFLTSFVAVFSIVTFQMYDVSNGTALPVLLSFPFQP